MLKGSGCQPTSRLLNKRATWQRTASEVETEQIGAGLAGRLAAGAVVLVYGELGAGKTVFVRGLAGGFGVDPEEVSSPTFTLIQEYRGRLTVHHVDLYRLSGPEVDELGLDELVAGDGVVVIEWADRLTQATEGAHVVRIVDRGGDMRDISIAEAGDIA